MEHHRSSTLRRRPRLAALTAAGVVGAAVIAATVKAAVVAGAGPH